MNGAGLDEVNAVHTARANSGEIIDVMVPQVTEETFEGVQIIPQEHVQNRTLEQFVDVPVPQSQEEIVDVIQPSKSCSRSQHSNGTNLGASR